MNSLISNNTTNLTSSEQYTPSRKFNRTHDDYSPTTFFVNIRQPWCEMDSYYSPLNLIQHTTMIQQPKSGQKFTAAGRRVTLEFRAVF